MNHIKYNIDLLSKYHKKEYDNYSDWLDRESPRPEGQGLSGRPGKFKTKINHAKDKVINDLLPKYNKPTLETAEEKVIRILKKDFEEKHGMTFDKFIETYQKILEESPEKLI